MIVLSKKTGLILVVALSFDKLILSKLFFKNSIKENKSSFKELLFLFIPVGLFVSFLIVQKINLGWFFFPKHMGMINTNYHEIIDRFKSFANQFFWSNGRNFLVFAFIISLIYAFIKRDLKKVIYIL